jgi:NAD(P)-dependent dehydrogenase (short-subunit alcohol dehydrogenase family)
VSGARVWLITGGSSGFGQALTAGALAAGETVVTVSRRPAEPQGHAVGVLDAIQLDVTDGARLNACVETVLDRHGRIDVLVNNAGRGLFGAAEESGDEELRALMDLHFFAPAALTRAVLPHMREAGAGTIVQISSQAGRFSAPGLGAYAASKFALAGWSEALAAEVEAFGIRVLIVEPGPFRTAFYGQGVLGLSTRNPAYDRQFAEARASLDRNKGDQPGDPLRAAAAIRAAVEAESPPLRLPLGNEAVDRTAEGLASAAGELERWEAVGRTADFSDTTLR